MVMHTDTTMFEARRQTLKKRMRASGMTALLVSNAANRYYLSGFELADSQCDESAGMLVVTDADRDYLLTDSRYLDAARRLWPEEDVFIYSGPRFERIAAFLKGRGVDRLWFESKHLNHFSYTRLRKQMPLHEAEDLVEGMRVIKDPDEIERLRASCAVNHKVMEAVGANLDGYAGMTEAEVAWEVEKFFREFGASELAFSSIVAYGPNAALPHAIPGETVLRENGPLLVDVGGRHRDYCSDQTRTFWVGGEPDDRFKRTKDLVRAAQDKAVASVRPGAVVSDLYRIAFDVFAETGEEAYFTHSLGHGIGLMTHEPPSLGSQAKAELRPGMVVTVEPGLYYPEWGGIRWEYMVLVTEDGAEVL